MSTTTTRRPMPWDVMGEKLKPKDAKSVEATLAAAGLDYQVETRQALSGHAPRHDGSGHNARTQLQADDFQAIVRPMPDGSERVLAFTKKRYTPIQNGAAFALADYLVKEFGAKIVGAADFRDGTRSVLAVKLPEDITLEGPEGQDRVGLHGIIQNDHAGNAALSLALTPLRFACTNVLPAALAEADRVWKISHTPNAQKRLDVAAEAMKRSLVYAEAFQAQAQAMLDQPMVDAEFAKLVAKLYPVKKDAEGVQAERRRDIQAKLMDAWKTSDTITTIRGTRWAGYNVVTEYLDHFRPVRGAEAVARAEGALDGPYVRQKAALWRTFANA